MIVEIEPKRIGLKNKIEIGVRGAIGAIEVIGTKIVEIAIVMTAGIVVIEAKGIGVTADTLIETMIVVTIEIEATVTKTIAEEMIGPWTKRIHTSTSADRSKKCERLMWLRQRRWKLTLRKR